ncbi:MAG: hypothetical protein J7639_33910, partial [Paenibacillaceae bacterium]|nr:hypothetical protein [Paenibacillaceae bacterium]
MNKTMTTLTGVTLVSALLLGACSSGKTKGNTAATQSPSASPSASAASPAATAAADDSKVYGVKWFGGYNYPFTDGTYGQKFMEDTFKINVTPVRVDTKEKLNLLISTGDVPDLMQLETSDLVSFVKNDVLAEIPLDLIKQHAPQYYDIVTKQDPNAFTNAKVNGKLYALPRTDSSTSPYPVAIRADWLTNVGADIPTTLQQLEDVFVKFRNNDPDKNGKNDTYALTMASD